MYPEGPVDANEHKDHKASVMDTYHGTWGWNGGGWPLRTCGAALIAAVMMVVVLCFSRIAIQ